MHVSTRIGFGVLVLACVIGAAYMIWPFVPALLWAATFSILLYPFYKRLLDRKWSESMAALATTAIPTLLFVIPLLVLGTIAGVQVFGYISSLVPSGQSGGEPAILATVAGDLDRILHPILAQFGAAVDVKQLILDNQTNIARNLTGPLTFGVKSFGTAILTVVISLLTTYFMLKDSHHMKEPVLDLVPLPREETLGILDKMAKTVRSVFNAVVVVAFIQGAIAGAAYAITGVKGWLVWMLVTTVFCMIPLLGAPVIFIPIGVSLLLQGMIWQGIVVLVVGFGVVSQIDNVLKPLFISGGTNIHPMAVFFALLGGVLVLGPVGLMAGPLLLTLVLAFVDIVRAKRRLEESAVAGSDSEAEPEPA